MRSFFPAAECRSAARPRRADPAARVGSEQISQISSMVKNPQRAGPHVARVAVMARAISSGCSPRACTIQSAIRSAERGPTPGICRSCAIKSRIAAGYSVFLKAAALTPGAYPSTARRAARAGADTIAAVHLPVRWPARFLELRVGFGPPFLAIKNDAVPEMIAPCDLFRSCFGRQRNRLVNLVPLARHRPRSRNRSVAPREPCWPARTCAVRAECVSHKSDSRCRNVAPIPPARRWRATSALVIVLQRRR